MLPENPSPVAPQQPSQANEPSSAPVVRFDAYSQPIGWKQALQKRFGHSQAMLIQLGITIAPLFFILVLLLSFIRNPGSLPIALFVVGVVALIGNSLLGAFKEFIAGAKRQLRLQPFAADNGWTYAEYGTSAGHPGRIFDQQSARLAYTSVVQGTYATLPFEFGNLKLTTGSGKEESHQCVGIIRVTLTRRLPNILLDGKANNSLLGSNIGGVARDQRFELEGDFNKYFDLYVPEGYDRDALYFITPELMQLLIDYGAKYDLEIVDNYLYVYSKGYFAFEKQSTIEAILKIIATIGQETQENTQRYADATVGNRAANIVAAPGQRLKATSPWVIFILLLIFWAVIFFWH